MSKEEFDEDIINQLLTINAMKNVTNRNDINEISQFIESNDYQSKPVNYNDDYVNEDNDGDDDDGDQTIAVDQMFKMLCNHDQTEERKVGSELPFGLSEIKACISQSTLIWNLNVPEYIVNVIALCCLTEFELIIDESMVLSVSSPEHSKSYGLRNLFIQKKSRCYCTSKNNECEIVINLTSKNHCSDSSKYDERLDQNGFIITQISVKPPGFGYSAPIRTFMMWVFDDKSKVPNEKEIKDKYGGQIDVKSLDVYDKETHSHLRNKEIENKCVVCIDGMKSRDKSHKCKLYDDLNSIRVVKAKYVLIKLMTPPDQDNVDTEQFSMKVMRL